MGVGEASVDEPVRAHDGQLGEVPDGVAVLDLDDDGGHLPHELVEPGRGPALVDLGQVLARRTSEFSLSPSGL